MNPFSKIRSLVHRAVATKSANDGGNFQIQQGKFHGNPRDFDMVYPYGMTANAPVGSAMLAWNVEASEDNKAAIAYYPITRQKNLSPGEVVFSNQLTGSKIYMKANGDVEITSPGQVMVNATSDVSITSGGNIIMNPTGQFIVNGDSLFNGNLFSTGNLTLEFGTGTQYSMSAFRASYNGHIHTDSIGGSTSATNSPI